MLAMCAHWSFTGTPCAEPTPGITCSGISAKLTMNWKKLTHCVRYHTSTTSRWNASSLYTALHAMGMLEQK